MKEDNGSNFVMMANRWMFGWKDATNPISQQRMLPISFSNGFAFFDFYDEVLYNADQDIIIPVQNGKLLSQEKTVTASSNTETAAYVNDGDYQTEWIGTKTWPSTWTVDLNATYNLSNIQISWYMMKGSEAYYKYKLEGSIDGLSYTTLLDKSSAYNDYGFTSDRLSGKARFVRVTLVDAKLQNNTNNWYTPQLYEVKVYGN
ncbi:discoidin domain-containing protein [Clostridium oryzae]|uniref:F5/8 type C domain protein n=1 Tax=Clostridium oryzae TaxID=1450648 RepID=A0A1V4IBW7_9CLOT|nr:discoidin domain-containing protein [Clostridium oryzae]OPJ57370.1 F5/8 type C domain protein [Clostridium oryzae]